MSCSKFETDIALYAGGDLPPGHAARVEAHLGECADCRAMAQDLQAFLSELRDEPLEDALVTQVHRRVLAQVRRADFSPRGALAPLLALAAGLVLAVVLAWPRHAVKQAPEARVAPPHLVPVPAVNIIPARHHAVRRHRAPAAQPGPPLLVQFVTDDPNIVVYWLIDQKTKGD